MRIHADSDPGQTFEMQKIRFLLLLADFYCSWIRIRIPDTDPDRGQSTMQGPLSKTNCFFL
jgi:hypothetical protein